MTRAQPPLRSQRLPLVNHQGDALRLGMNWIGDELGWGGSGQGRIAGLGVDDIEEEPPKQRDWRPSSPLFTLPNLVVTPRAASRAGGRGQASPGIRSPGIQRHNRLSERPGPPPPGPVPGTLAQLHSARPGDAGNTRKVGIRSL